MRWQLWVEPQQPDALARAGRLDQHEKGRGLRDVPVVEHDPGNEEVVLVHCASHDGVSVVVELVRVGALARSGGWRQMLRPGAVGRRWFLDHLGRARLVHDVGRSGRFHDTGRAGIVVVVAAVKA